MRIERDAQPLGDSRRGATQLEPASMHAVAGAVDVAARDALVRLHQIESVPPPGPARGLREGPVAPQVAEVEWVDLQVLARAPALFLSRQERDIDPGSFQRRKRPADEALRPAVGAVALPDDGQLHFASSSRAA